MKRLVAKVGEYQNQQGETKGEYLRIGVIGESQNGEYILLDPTINLAGVLTQQNIYAHSQKKKPSKRVMVSIFDDSSQGGQYQQNTNQGRGQQNQAANQQPGNSAPSQGPSFDDDIPFAPIAKQYRQLLNVM